MKKKGRKKKEKIDGAPDKKRILELEEENRKLRERIAEDGDDEEYQPDYSLLPNKKNLPSVEELREQIRFEPHYAIGGILIECANRISSIACCSNNIRGDLVRKLRICASAGGFPATLDYYKRKRRQHGRQNPTRDAFQDGGVGERECGLKEMCRGLKGTIAYI